MVSIQENLYDYMRHSLNTALDTDAEAVLAMENYKDLKEHQQFIHDLIKPKIARLVARQVLSPEDLIEALVYLDAAGYDDWDPYIESRFFFALQVLQHSDWQKSDPAKHELFEGLIWRRCFIQDDWEISNRTEGKDEEQIIAVIENTMLFATAKELFANGKTSPCL